MATATPLVSAVRAPSIAPREAGLVKRVPRQRARTPTATTSPVGETRGRNRQARHTSNAVEVRPLPISRSTVSEFSPKRLHQRDEKSAIPLTGIRSGRVHICVCRKNHRHHTVASARIVMDIERVSAQPSASPVSSSDRAVSSTPTPSAPTVPGTERHPPYSCGPAAAQRDFGESLAQTGQRDAPRSGHSEGARAHRRLTTKR